MKQQKDWRYELKYVVEPERMGHIYALLQNHPGSFSKQHADRWVNNIYLDNTSLDNARANLSGISDRQKYRIRWYGQEGDTADKVLELKIKNNSLGRKEYFRLGKSFDYIGLDRRELSSMLPSLQNQYLRSYYIDFSGRYRLTLDRSMSYSLPDVTSQLDLAKVNDPKVIMEIKFNKADISGCAMITQNIPFRLTKNSKYVNGVMALY